MFSVRRNFATLKNIKELDPPELRDCAGSSEELSSLVKKCLEKDPTKRPSYAELLQNSFLSSFDQKTNSFALANFCASLDVSSQKF